MTILKLAVTCAACCTSHEVCDGHDLFSKARAELASLLDNVNDDAAPIEIVRRDKPSAVLISKDDYEGMAETLYLLSTPANAARLHQRRMDVEAGRFLAPSIPGVTDE